MKPERYFGDRPVPEDVPKNVKKNIVLPGDVVHQITGKTREEYFSK
ncbi:MAG: hypothetical protein ACFFD4_21930 [Candidatus Odinarchaeota archaeon]